LRSLQLRANFRCDGISIKPYAPKYVVTRVVLKKFGGQSEFVNGGIDARCSQVLSNSGADAPDTNSVLNAHNDSVVSRHVNNCLRDGDYPARINDGDAESVLRQFLSNRKRKWCKGSDGHEQDVRARVLVQNVNPILRSS
jgi:hypothetical protein